MKAVAILSILLCAGAMVAQEYKHGPDSMEQPDVPKGKVTKHTWKSEIFPGTVRDYWIYVPAQYDAKTPANVMVFQDGGSYVNTKGDFRVPTVFDNLIHQKKMPMTFPSLSNRVGTPHLPVVPAVANAPSLLLRVPASLQTHAAFGFCHVLLSPASIARFDQSFS